MAQTIIVSPTSEPVSLPQRDGRPARWRCLARRGMVFSELEGFDHYTVEPGARLCFPPHSHSELAVLIAAGAGDALMAGGHQAVAPGDLILDPVGPGFTLANSGDSQLEVVSVEIMARQYADRLPYRAPMIVDLPQKVA